MMSECFRLITVCCFVPLCLVFINIWTVIKKERNENSINCRRDLKTSWAWSLRRGHFDCRFNLHGDRWPCGCLASYYLVLVWEYSLPLLIPMADQHLTTAAKKSKKKGGGGMVKLFRDLIKQPKSANDSGTNQSNSTRFSISSAFGVHDSVPGNDAGSVKSTASSKCILTFILVLSTTTT